MCKARANVNTKALFNSSLSAETGGFSERPLDNCGCTSLLPKPVIRRKAVLSTL